MAPCGHGLIKCYLTNRVQKVSVNNTLSDTALIKNILSFEHIQSQATKFILNNYNISYKNQLLELILLPLMYIFKSRITHLQLSPLQEILKLPTILHSLKYTPDPLLIINLNIINTQIGGKGRTCIPGRLTKA